MTTEVILTTALFIGIPVTLKYILSFEIRTQVALVKASEREVAGLSNRLAALKQEQDNVRRAVSRVQHRRTWVETRQSLIAHELTRVREATFQQPQTTESPYPSVEWEALANS